MLYEHLISVNPAAETSLTAVEEVDTIILDVKTDHIASQHTLEQTTQENIGTSSFPLSYLQYFIAPWEDPDNVPGWKWNV